MTKVFLFVFLPMLTYQYQQPTQRRTSVPYVANAAASRNPAELVVAVTAVLGLETAQVLLTQIFITRGTRAYRPAKHGRS